MVAPPTEPEVARALIAVIPVVVGGLLTLFGALCSGYLLNRLKRKSDREDRRAQKLEELIGGVFEVRHWLTQVNHYRVFGGEDPNSLSPMYKVRAIAYLFFPELKAQVDELDLKTDEYEMWMFEVGQERLAKGKLSDERMASAKKAFGPYLKASHELVKAAEALAKVLRER